MLNWYLSLFLQWHLSLFLSFSYMKHQFIFYIRMEAQLNLLPKRPYPLKENAFQRKDTFVTNHYRISINKYTDIYQFVLESDPNIPDDSIPLLRELVKSARGELTSALGFVTHKGKVLWGLKSIEKMLILKSRVNQRNYELLIKPTRCFKEFEIGKLEGKALKQVLQVYSVALK